MQSRLATLGWAFFFVMKRLKSRLAFIRHGESPHPRHTGPSPRRRLQVGLKLPVNGAFPFTLLQRNGDWLHGSAPDPFMSSSLHTPTQQHALSTARIEWVERGTLK